MSTPLEDGLARRLRIGQHLGVDVDHHLVALPRGAGIEAVVEGRLREQGQGVRLLLGGVHPWRETEKQVKVL